jgi:TonB family protein
MNTLHPTQSATKSPTTTRAAAGLRTGALALGVLGMSLLYPLAADAQISLSTSSVAKTAAAVPITLVESTSGTVAPLLLNTNQLGRDAMNQYPGWIDWNNPRQAEFLLQVDADGRVKYVKLSQSSGHPLVDRALQDVARDMRFTPARLEGESVGVWVRVPVKVQGGSPSS